MSFGYKPVGRFASEADAIRWARDNNIDPQDVVTSPDGPDGQVRASVRDDDNPKGDWRDRPNDRRDGFF